MTPDQPRYTRRRQIIANQEDPQIPPHQITPPTSPVDFKRRKQVLHEKTNPPPEKVTPVGHCPKCQKRIGRGVYFHAKNCKG